ncbi:MAG: zinc ribbon domain-containing protein [Acidobacteria bacterium]|nr:zinc ribbon domain-containing protein [Acidobacteriota bacterium]
MSMACPGCGEELPDGARFCGACGTSLAAPTPGTIVCPLCRTEIPAGARFCGECGQPLGSGDSLSGLSSFSMPAGMLRVPLVHGPFAAAPSLPLPSQPPPAVAPLAAPSSVAAADAAEPPVAGYTELAAPEAEEESAEEIEPELLADGEPEVEPAIELDVEVAEADGQLEFAGVDELVQRGHLEEALARLSAMPGFAPREPPFGRRLETLAHELGRAAAAKGRSGESAPAALREELRRLLRLARERGFRDVLRAELAPAAAEADIARVRELLGERHLEAAATVVEKILALAPRLTEFRALRHEVIQAIVAQANAAQRAGDAAWKKGDAAGARARWAEALELLENDRALLARLDRA